MAMRAPTSRLKSVDFPTFGRPTTATTGRGPMAPAGTGCLCPPRRPSSKGASSPSSRFFLATVGAPVCTTIDGSASGLQRRAVSLSIEIVSDVVCPWCFLGHARLKTALAARPDLDPSIRFTPFLLDPSIPKDGRDLREHLGKKYGVDPERMFGRVEAAARESGIPLDFGKIRRFPSTLPAHVV